MSKGKEKSKKEQKNKEVNGQGGKGGAPDPRGATKPNTTKANNTRTLV